MGEFQYPSLSVNRWSQAIPAKALQCITELPNLLTLGVKRLAFSFLIDHPSVVYHLLLLDQHLFTLMFSINVDYMPCFANFIFWYSGSFLINNLFNAITGVNFNNCLPWSLLFHCAAVLLFRKAESIKVTQYVKWLKWMIFKRLLC